jgi:hypothetical protein
MASHSITHLETLYNVFMSRHSKVINSLKSIRPASFCEAQDTVTARAGGPLKKLPVL